MKQTNKSRMESEIIEWFEKYKEASEVLNELKKEKKQIDKKVERLLDQKGEGEYNLMSKKFNTTVICRRVLNRKVVFEPDKLERRIDDKDVLDKIIDKTYVINDWKKFACFLKGKGIKAKDILKFIEVQKEVNNEQLDQLEEIGVISYDDIKGCFYCTDLSSYIRYTIKK